MTLGIRTDWGKNWLIVLAGVVSLPANGGT